MSNGFLSQEEINALLNGEAEANPTEETKKEEVIEEELSDIEKDLLGEIGNISMGSASTALYQIINQSVNITTPKVEMTTLREIKSSFDAPTVVVEVEYKTGIIGRNILVIRTVDAAIIANLMMGGDGNIDKENVELSELEISAVQEAMNQMIGSASTSMATMFAREVNIAPPMSKIWSKTEDKITDTIPEEEKIVRVNFRMTIGDVIDSTIMQVLPLQTAKKIVSIMMGNEEQESKPEAEAPKAEAPKQEVNEQNIAKNKPQTTEAATYAEAPPVQAKSIVQTPVEVHSASFDSLGTHHTEEAPKNIDLILDVPLDISVVLGRTRKKIKDILSLGTGSLIELEKLAEEPVEILVNGKKIAFGEVVVVDENFGVRITSIVSNVERIKSLN